MRRALALLSIPLCMVLAAGLAVSVLATAGGIEGRERVEPPVAVGASADPPPACEQYVPFQTTPPDVGAPPAEPPPGPLSAVVSTNCGDIEIALDPTRFPRTVASFVHLARNGFYDGTAVDRVLRGRLFEGGGTGAYTIRERPPRGTRYPRGTVAMAHDDGEAPGTSSSRFFVVTGADARIPPVYAVIGRVTGGLDAVRVIDGLGGETGEPAQEVPIMKVTIRP